MSKLFEIRFLVPFACAIGITFSGISEGQETPADYQSVLKIPGQNGRLQNQCPEGEHPTE